MKKIVTLRAGRVARRPLTGLAPLVLLIALASSAVLGIACGQGEEPTPTVAPAETPPTATATPAPAPTPTPMPASVNEDDELTMAYVQGALERYERDGLEATVAYYSSGESIEGERFLFIIDADDGAMVAMPFHQGLIGSKHVLAGQFLEIATEEGGWLEHRGIHPDVADGAVVREQPLRSYLVLRDGLLFMSSHSVLLESLADATRDYVSRAIARYESEGLEATVDYYNSQNSLEGPFYLFLIGADYRYIVHPIFPHLIGTDIRDVVGSEVHWLGKEIAEATEEGIWVEYLWPNPVTRVDEPKATWAIRHDGLIFASGYYASGVTAEAPARRKADLREYTVEYVRRAIERYERDGPDSMVAYYNSFVSFEGEWYLFATDESDIYIVHPLLPRLIGTDIKDVVASDGYEVGKEIAKATEEGIWVEYLWPHPVTLEHVPKVGYAVRHDGKIFASGYYPGVAEPGAHTKAYVQEAMDYYDREGIEETVRFYNTRESVDGSYWLMMVDPEGSIIVSSLAPELVGMDARMFKGILAGEPIGEELVGATEEGHWIRYLWPNERTAGALVVHLWMIRHDGYVFSSAYYEEE